MKLPVAGKVVPLSLNANHLICSFAGKSQRKREREKIKKKIKRKTKLFCDTVVIPLGKGLQEGFQLKFTESLIEVIKCLLLDKKTEQ